MPYIPPAPSVQYGLIDFKLPNGQVIQIPKAFRDRIMYDLVQSRQLGANAVGGIITPDEMLGHSFGGGIRGAQGQVRSTRKTPYTSYAMMSPQSNYLQQLQQLYGGTGRAIQNTRPYQQLQNLSTRRQVQQKALQGTGAQRKINLTASGQVTGDTGRPITSQDIQALQPAINREERKAQGTMMQDLQNFQRMGSIRTTSNVPTVTTSTGYETKRIEDSLRQRILRQTIPRQVDAGIQKVV